MDSDASRAAQEDQDQRDRLQRLYQLALEIAELRDLQQVLDLALRHCLELTGSQFGFVGLNRDDGSAMDVVAFQGYQVSRRFYERFHLLMPLRPPLLSHAAQESQPSRSSNAKRDARRVGQPRGHPPVHAFLGVPLRLRGSPMGMIGMANRPGGYAEEHEQLLATYATQVAIAIHNARLYAQVQEMVISEERTRLAREMHDSLAQVLFYVNTQAEAARLLLQSGHTERATEQLEQLAHTAGAAYADVREDILALRTVGRNGGLVKILNSYLPLWQEQSGVRAELVVIPAGVPLPVLSPAVEIQLIRIVQEALANVRKHAQARQVRIQIRGEVKQITVMIQDDGVGFDPSEPEQSGIPHFGLATMQERAAGVGGHLKIDSTPGRGTRVHVRVPVEAAPHDGVRSS